jgi:HD domain
MFLAGIKVVDTSLVRDAIDLARSSSEPYLFNHVMRSWLFAVLIAEETKFAPDPELLAVSTVLHDLGMTDRYAAAERFEVDSANAARAFLKERDIPAQQGQLVWDSIALHTTRSIALHKEPEVAMTHSGIAVDVIGAGLDLIPQEKAAAILIEFPRLGMKWEFRDYLSSIVRRKPATTYDNVLRDIGVRYVEDFAAPSFADLLENAPFAE